MLIPNSSARPYTDLIPFLCPATAAPNRPIDPARLYARTVAEASDVTVRDNEDENVYELLLDGSRVGVVHYLPMRDAVVLVHTEIAPELEGKGLGGRLVAGALADIRARGLRLVAVCPFVSSYLERHPEQGELVERPKTRTEGD